jgi:hypothetical protein
MLSQAGQLRGLKAGGVEWRDRETGELVDLTGRCLVLAYGSNPDPAKLLRRRGFFGGDSVIALRRAVFGWPLPGATLAAQTDRWSPFKALSAARGGGMTTAGRRRIRAWSQ